MGPAQDTKLELQAHGQISRMTMPGGWMEGAPEPYTGIGGRSFRHYYPPDQPDVKLCFFYRGLPVSQRSAAEFSALLDKEPHALTPAETESVGEILRDRKSAADFQMADVRTEMVSGKNVLVLRGIYIQIQHETLAMCIDADGTGRLIQEIYYQAPVAHFASYLKHAKAALRSIEWL